jgi:hypothetical protein
MRIRPRSTPRKCYYDPPDADGAPGIDVDPPVRDAEAIEMLNLLCLAVIGVFLGVAELLEQDTSPTGTMAAEYQVLTERSGQMQGDEPTRAPGA